MDNVITNNAAECAHALDALKTVIDPEIGLNVVDLGLIYQVDVEEINKELFVSMTLTTQFCPMGESIRDAALRALQDAFPSYKIHLDLVFDPPWNAERISEKGREFLNN